MKLTSQDFKHQGFIPSQFTCDGANTIPELKVFDIPAKAHSLVLIIDDPDIPEEIKKSRDIEVFDHFVLFNIPTHTIEISETSGTLGRNSAGDNAYRGPCPPPEYQPTTHRYFFKLYALDVMLDLKLGVTKTKVESAMKGHIVQQTELIGKYDRSA
jgi:Raf kinase inhibitor-like YbhB/YbcL family protein